LGGVCVAERKILDYVRKNPVEAIVELGSGFGQNLIKLYYQGCPQIPLFAGELTESGTACCQRISSLKPQMNLSAFRYDFNHPTPPILEGYKRILVFTCHAIEQVEQLNENALPAIARFAPHVHCIHFEPFGFQLYEGENDVDKNQSKAFHQAHWNLNLFQRLLEANNQKHLALKFVRKNIAGSFDDGLNPTSIAIWQSSNS
jgi:hypothetical protein